MTYWELSDAKDADIGRLSTVQKVSGPTRIVNYAKTVLLASLRGLRLLSFKSARMSVPRDAASSLRSSGCVAEKVGQRGFEPRTSRLSAERST